MAWRKGNILLYWFFSSWSFSLCQYFHGKVRKKVLTPRAQLNRYFGRNVLTTFYVWNRTKDVWRVRCQDEILEKYISEFDFTGRERSLITYVRLCSRSIVNVSSSDGHRNAERSFLFDFTPKCCVSGLLRTRC